MEVATQFEIERQRYEYRRHSEVHLPRYITQVCKPSTIFVEALAGIVDTCGLTMLKVPVKPSTDMSNIIVTAAETPKHELFVFEPEIGSRSTDRETPEEATTGIKPNNIQKSYEGPQLSPHVPIDARREGQEKAIAASLQNYISWVLVLTRISS